MIKYRLIYTIGLGLTAIATIYLLFILFTSESGSKSTKKDYNNEIVVVVATISALCTFWARSKIE
jgi:hypothetical protein